MLSRHKSSFAFNPRCNVEGAPSRSFVPCINVNCTLQRTTSYVLRNVVIYVQKRRRNEMSVTLISHVDLYHLWLALLIGSYVDGIALVSGKTIN